MNPLTLVRKSTEMLNEKETREFLNEVAMPAYRQFCREHGLKFRLLEEPPETLFDRQRSSREFDLHEEAMALFNRLQPSMHFFQNHVVELRLSPWFLDFGYNAEPIDVFLRKQAQLAERLATIEQRYQLLQVALAISGFFLITGIASLLPQRFLTEPILVIVGFCLIAAWVTGKLFFDRFQYSRKQREERELLMRLERLREQLDVIQKQA